MTHTHHKVALGLTGPAGCGKSAQAALLVREGFFLIDGDVEGKALLQEPPLTLRRIVIDLLGEPTYTSLGYNIPYVRERVFGDIGLRDLFNAMVQPYLEERVAGRLTEAKVHSSHVVVDAAMLPFWPRVVVLLDRVIWLDVPAAIRRERLLAKGLTAQAANARLFAALPDELYRGIATDRYDGCESIETIFHQIRSKR